MKKTTWSIITLSAVIVVASGCASTSLTGYTDPAFADRSFQNVAVYVETSDIGDRQALEYTVAKYGEKADLHIMPTIELLPPTREVDRQIAMEAVRSHGYDAVLYVSMRSAGSNPGVGTMMIPTANGGMAPSVYSYRTLHAEFDATLVEVDSGGVVWRSSSDSSTSDIGSWGDLLNSYAKTVVGELKINGLII